MRTTMDLDEDVLLAFKDLSRREHKTIGKIVSEMGRKIFLPGGKIQKFRNGFPLLPHSGPGKLVTMELVNRLRDEDP